MSRKKNSAAYADEPWFKINRRVFDSSVWEEDPPTRIVWFTLLSLAQLPENRKHGHGMVVITPGNLTRKAFVSAEQFQHAISRLTAPDPTSRTNPGEPRLKLLPNGYFIPSFDLYHDADEFDRWHAQRVEAGKARAAKAPRSGGRFTSGTPAVAGKNSSGRWPATSKTETETETDTMTETDTDGTEPVPSRSHSPMTTATATAIEETAARIEKNIPTVPASEWIKRASSIAAGNGHEAKSFSDPRSKRLTEAWGQTTLTRLRALHADAERPVPL